MKTTKKITNFALNPDQETLRQFKQCYSETYVVKASLMPDAHVGYVAPIGSVLVTKNKIVPAWVGYDIGCGMTAAKLPKKILAELMQKKEEIYRQVKKTIPMGLGSIYKSEKEVTEETRKTYQKILLKFEKGKYNKQVLDFLKSGKALRSLGTLGHGNHFIELDIDSSGYPWIVVHSGSRTVGHWTAKFYMKKSSGKEKGLKQHIPLKQIPNMEKNI